MVLAATIVNTTATASIPTPMLATIGEEAPAAGAARLCLPGRLAPALVPPPKSSSTAFPAERNHRPM